MTGNDTSAPRTPGLWEADCVDPEAGEYVVWALPWDSIRGPVASQMNRDDARWVAAVPRMASLLEALAAVGDAAYYVERSEEARELLAQIRGSG